MGEGCEALESGALTYALHARDLSGALSAIKVQWLVHVLCLLWGRCWWGRRAQLGDPKVALDSLPAPASKHVVKHGLH